MSGWTAEQDETLRKLHVEGLSTREIAARLGKSSRNAVIGRLHRKAFEWGLQLKGGTRPPVNYKRVLKPKAEQSDAPQVNGPSLVKVPGGKASPETPKPEPVKRNGARPGRQRPADVPPLTMGTDGKKSEAYFAEGFAGQTGRVDLLGLKDSLCKFPITQGDGAVRYCGDVAEEGVSYCSHHAARCFNGAPPPKVLTSTRMGRPFSL